MEEVDDADLYGQISADEVKQIANNQKQDKAQSQASSATAASKIGALQLSSDELMNDANEDFYDEDQDDFDIVLQPTAATTPQSKVSSLSAPVQAVSSSALPTGAITSSGISAQPAASKPALNLNAPGTLPDPRNPDNSISIFDANLDDDEIFEERPWRRPGADLTDYFNYGFDEQTWREYVAKQKSLRAGISAEKAQSGKTPSVMSSVPMSAMMPPPPDPASLMRMMQQQGMPMPPHFMPPPIIQQEANRGSGMGIPPTQRRYQPEASAVPSRGASSYRERDSRERARDHEVVSREFSPRDTREVRDSRDVTRDRERHYPGPSSREHRNDHRDSRPADPSRYSSSSSRRGGSSGVTPQRSPSPVHDRDRDAGSRRSSRHK